MRRLADVLAPLTLVVLLLAAWEIACRALEVPVYLLPAPSAIWISLTGDWQALAAASWTTLSMALIALLIASICACTLGLLGGLSPLVEKAIQPVAVTIQVTPVIAIAPLVMIWTGLDHPGRAIIILATIVAFFPIYSGAATGLRAADPDLKRLFALYGANRWQTLTRLRLPSALPALIEGHKVATALAVIGAVVAEFVAGSGGLRGWPGVLSSRPIAFRQPGSSPPWSPSRSWLRYSMPWSGWLNAGCWPGGAAVSPALSGPGYSERNQLGVFLTYALRPRPAAGRSARRRYGDRGSLWAEPPP